MFLKFLRAKIHRAVVTEACLDYIGSITIDADLLEASGILPGECVLVANLANGNRFETYVFEGEKGSGVICLNGAAAHCAEVGDKVIIMAYGYGEHQEVVQHVPRVVIVGEKNTIDDICG